MLCLTIIIHIVSKNLIYCSSIQIFDDLCDFKFIPLKKLSEDPVTEQDGITRRTFSTDTSYIIVKYENSESVREKRSRLDNMIKKIQSKPDKKPVDLR